MIQNESNSLATASMILGIVSLVTSCCCFLGVILGSLAVLLACLSRTEMHFSGHARAGLIMGILSILLSIVVLLALVAGSASANFRGPNVWHFYY